jgi:hypothetical protein
MEQQRRLLFKVVHGERGAGGHMLSGQKAQEMQKPCSRRCSSCLQEDPGRRGRKDSGMKSEMEAGQSEKGLTGVERIWILF